MGTLTRRLSSDASRRTWTAQLFSLPTVLGFALVTSLFVFTGPGDHAFGMNDPDIWWHLGNAREMLRSGHVAHVDAWTFTVGGRPWIDFEWLGELVYFFAWRAFGPMGLYALMMLLASAITIGIYCLDTLRSGDCKAAFLATLLGLHFELVSLQPRPLLFGWFFLVVELLILWNIERGRNYGAFLPPLFMLWINMHGSWLIGFALMIVFFVAGCVEGEWGRISATRWSPQQMLNFVRIIVASIVCLFVNPYGWRLVAYPLDVAFRQKGTVSSIEEWASINFHNMRGKLVLATLILFALLFLVRNRRWPLQDLAFCLIAVYAGFTYVRFIFLMGIIMVPLLAMEMRGILPPPYDPAKDKRWVNAVAICILASMTITFWQSSRKIEATFRDAYPVRALPYLRSIAGQGNLFQQFEWGAWITWNVPQLKTFIDSRVDIFVHAGVMDDYMHAIRLEDSLAVLDKYRIRYVLIRRDSALAYLLAESSLWKPSYQDSQAIVFERVE